MDNPIICPSCRMVDSIVAEEGWWICTVCGWEGDKLEVLN